MYPRNLYCLLPKLQRLLPTRSMADCAHSSVLGSVYTRYNAGEVLELLDIDEPCTDADSEDDLDLDLGSGRHPHIMLA